MKNILIVFVLILSLVLFVPQNVFAGTSLANVSQTMSVISIKNDQELDRIVEQLIEARRASQKTLSAEEIEKIRQQAQEVLKGQKADIDTGAMVYTGCQIIEK